MTKYKTNDVRNISRDALQDSLEQHKLFLVEKRKIVFLIRYNDN